MPTPPRSSVSPSTDRRRATGVAGETAAQRWYESQGYEVLDRNWRRRNGELDLVLLKDRVLVFCEVKTRTSTTFGSPVEAITREKRRRIRLLAGVWLEEHKPIVRQLRFDVASVLQGRDGALTLDVLEGAF